MRKLCSIFLLASFTLISALANFGESHAYAIELDQDLSKTTVEITADAAGQTAVDLSVVEPTDNSSKDDCPCKKHSASSFICGVSLALVDSDQSLYSPAPSGTLAALPMTAVAPEFVERLKRPPRTTL